MLQASWPASFHFVDVDRIAQFQTDQLHALGIAEPQRWPQAMLAATEQGWMVRGHPSTSHHNVLIMLAVRTHQQEQHRQQQQHVCRQPPSMAGTDEGCCTASSAPSPICHEVVEYEQHDMMSAFGYSAMSGRQVHL